MDTALTATRRRSALETFAACSYRWDQLYRRGVVDESAAARRGTTFHACAHTYIQALWSRRESLNQDLAPIAFRAAVAASPCPADLLGEVDDLFARWVESFELDLDAYVLAEENPADPDGYQLRIDLAYARGEVLEIVDWKTHYQVWTADRVRASFQAQFYAARARRIWPGFRVYRVILVFVRFGAAVPVEYTAADLDRVDTYVEALEAGQAAAIREHEATGAPWPATPGDHCGYCSLACPVVDEPTALDPVRVATRAEAEQVAGQYIALMHAIAARRAVLAGYTAQFGPLDVAGVTFEHRPSQSIKYPAAAVVDVIRGAGVEPGIEIGKTAIRPYVTAKKWAHVRADLEALARAKTSTRFGMHRTTDTAGDSGEDGHDEN